MNHRAPEALPFPSGAGRGGGTGARLGREARSGPSDLSLPPSAFALALPLSLQTHCPSIYPFSAPAPRSPQSGSFTFLLHFSLPICFPSSPPPRPDITTRLLRGPWTCRSSGGRISPSTAA